MTEVPIRDAATVIALRDPGGRASVLMGQRGARAVFMPMKYVFPGGAVDQNDARIPLSSALPAACTTRLAEASEGPTPEALAAAAIRELWEETGLILGRRGTWDAAPPDWTGFAATGHVPDAAALRFVFRAITPPGRPRRFDARFFLVDAARLQGDIDDFTHATDELSHLQWVPLEEVRKIDLPFITEVVLAEIAARLPDLGAPESVPFFRNDDEEAAFLRLRGTA